MKMSTDEIFFTLFLVEVIRTLFVHLDSLIKIFWNFCDKGKEIKIEPCILEEEDSNAVESKYQQIILHCKKTNTMFLDEEFPPNSKSLAPDSTLEGKLASGLKWSRVVEFEEVLVKTSEGWETKRVPCGDPPWSIYRLTRRNMLFTYQVMQTNVGNCGLIAALSSITIHPEIVQRVFSQSNVSEYGVYKVRLCVFGEWKTLFMDDWFPCDFIILNIPDRHRHPKFLNGQIWGSMIEKAIAKICGSYADMDGFSSHYTFMMVTGDPISTIMVKKYPQGSEELWKLLLDLKKKTYPMICDSSSDALKGLNKHHAYSIIDIVEFGTYRLLFLRDPNVETKWNGNWSAQWAGWPSSMAEEFLNRQKELSGSFWIEWNDFLINYDTVVVCRYRPSFKVIRIRMVLGGKLDDSHKAIRITVPENGKICVSVTDRHVLKRRDVAWISIHHTNNRGDIGELIACEMTLHSTKDIDLPKGEYVIIISDIMNFKKRDCTIALHSSCLINSELIELTPDMLLDSFKLLALSRGEEICVERTDVSIKRYLDEEASFYLLMAENFDENKYLHVYVTWDSNNYMNSTRDRYLIYALADVIPPKKSMILNVGHYLVEKNVPMLPIKLEYFLSDKHSIKSKDLISRQHHPGIDEWNIHKITPLDVRKKKFSCPRCGHRRSQSAEQNAERLVVLENKMCAGHHFE